MRQKNRRWWPAVYAGVLALFTAYVMLDTFVLATVVRRDAAQENTALFQAVESAQPEPTAAPAQEPEAKASDPEVSAVSLDDEEEGALPAGGENTVYQDDNIRIDLTEYRENGTTLYVADVWLTSAQYLKTAFAQDAYGKNVTAPTSEIAAAHDAILAINGDFYGARESGYVIRNGVLYRDFGGAGTDVLCVYADGHVEITNSGEKTAQELLDEGVWQVFSFGPALVTDGQVSVVQGEEVGKAMASNPRTAIGVVDDLHYVLVVSDGRTGESQGLSLYELADFLRRLGVTTAYNLDGGGSSTMVLDGQVVNRPTTNGSRIKERSVSDIVYIGA